MTGAPAARFAVLLAVLLLAPLASAHPAAAQSQCSRAGCGYLSPQCGGSPALPVPQPVWQGGELQPADTAPIPLERDGTAFDEFGNVSSYFTNPFYFDITNTVHGYLFVLQAYRFQVWDPHTTPANPSLKGNLEFSGFPYQPTGEPKWPLNSVAVPPDVDNVAAISGDYNVGIAILNTSDLTAPKVLYQGYGPSSSQVYAATLGGVHYAFLTSAGPTQVFNMDRAMQLSNPCTENLSTNPGGSCPGVYVGTVGSRDANFVGGVDHFIAISSANQFAGGFDVYDVTNPSSPQLKVTAIPGMAVYGVAMWKDAAQNYYVAARTVDANNNAGLAIVNVTCATGTCSGAPAPIFTGTFNEVLVQRLFVTFSRDGNGTPFVYIGSEDRCGVPTTQREWLLDVSNPASPHDVTPPPQVYPASGGSLTGYWGWYYRPNATGFNLVGGRHGKFIGEYFYRAAWTLFDIHLLAVNAPPVAGFSYSPAQIYPGTPVTFTDLTTGGPHSDAWTFSPDATPPSSTSTSPTVTFAAPGQKSVSLTASTSSLGSNMANQTLNVLNPAPVVQSVTVAPAAPLQCQPVSLTANATGQPTLAYSWTILNAGNTSVATGSTNPFTWNTGVSTPAGSYTAKVTVSNGAGSISFPQTVILGALGTLPPSLSFAPTDDAFTAGNVQFHLTPAIAPGATLWNWNFGDNANGGPAGDGYSGWTSDPVAGPNPSHNYQNVGNYSVTVKVQNCTVSQPSVSNALPITIVQTTPLVANFTPVCSFGFCSFPAGTAVLFVDASTGASTWDYDWDGSGAFADAGHTAPVTAHTYSAQGHFVPSLRVHRGSQTNTFTFTRGITIQPASPPSVSVSGPSEGVINTAYSYTASASNCTPAATWTWAVSGGVIGGSPTGSTITVTWASQGNYSVTASNSGCSGAQGGISVAIGNGSTSGGSLTAQFVFSPTSPNIGDTVKFDASSSTGSPVTWVWSFGDGQSGNGETVSHAYAAAGNYIVNLTETAPGTGTGCVSNICASGATQTVVVAGPPPPPQLNATFGATGINVQCVSQFGFNECSAATAETVTLTATETRATTYAWNFGDGTTGSGATVTHTWTQPASYPVNLTVSGPNFTSATHQVSFNITGPPPPPPVPVQNMLLPWIAESRGALVQSSDLYVHNPDSQPVDVTLTFLKRGTPESNPPQVTQTLQPGQTLYAPDVLSTTFNRENIAGFITLSAKTNVAPIITAFNTTQANGLEFGQTVPEISLPQSTSSAAANLPAVQELIGLNDNANEFSYFGITNPNASTSTYHLRFFDSTGAQIGDSGGDLTLGSFGQRQFQLKDIRRLFGVKNATDYRIEVDTTSGSQVYPFGANVRFTSQAPTFVGLGESSASKLYVLGVFSTAGSWQSDVLLANTDSAAATSALTFTRFGLTSRPTAQKTLTLQPGETHRLTNAVSSEFGINSAVGVLTVESTSGSSGIFPIVQGETYNSANPANQYGQAIPAFTDAEAAAASQSQFLVGLRQDAHNQTTLWLFNPGSDVATFDIVYRGLDGTVVKTVAGVAIPAGRMRQYLPAQLPLPAGGVLNGFTVQLNVTSGKLLSAAQVVNLTSGAPAYIKGVTR